MADISGMAGGMGDDGAMTVPFHPRPLNVQVQRFVRGDTPITVIARTWRIDDALRCRLCPAARCTASVGTLKQTALCLKSFAGDIPDDEVALFAERGDVAGRRPQRGVGGAVAT